LDEDTYDLGKLFGTYILQCCWHPLLPEVDWGCFCWLVVWCFGPARLQFFGFLGVLWQVLWPLMFLPFSVFCVVSVVLFLVSTWLHGQLYVVGCRAGFFLSSQDAGAGGA